MSAIGPGDWVECVDVSPGSFGPPPLLVLHAIYQVRAIVLGRDARGTLGDGVLLVGVFLPEPFTLAPEASFDLARFAPIYRPQEHAFDYLLENLPAELEREGVSA